MDPNAALAILRELIARTRFADTDPTDLAREFGGAVEIGRKGRRLARSGPARNDQVHWMTPGAETFGRGRDRSGVARSLTVAW